MKKIKNLKEKLHNLGIWVDDVVSPPQVAVSNTIRIFCFDEARFSQSALLEIRKLLEHKIDVAEISSLKIELDSSYSSCNPYIIKMSESLFNLLMLTIDFKAEYRNSEQLQLIL